MNWSPNNFNDIISEYYGSDAVHLIHPDPDEYFTTFYGPAAAEMKEANQTP